MVRPVLAILLAFLTLTGVRGQENEPASGNVETPVAEKSPAEASLESLQALGASILSKNDEITALEEAINAIEIEAQKEPLLEKSKQLQTELTELELQFETVAGGGVDLTIFQDAQPEPVELQKELIKLLQPIIDEAKKATETPREIERLRAEIAKFEERKALAETALETLRAIETEAAAQSKDEEVNAANENENADENEKFDVLTGVRKAKEAWETRRDEAENQLTVTTHQLQTKEANQQPFIDSTREMVLRFFRSRGMNLLLGLSAFFLVYGGLRFIYRQAQRIAILKRGGRTFGGRLIDVLYQIFVFIAALFAMVMVFYLTHDLVLLGFTLLFVAGVSWGGVRFLPGYLEQVRLMLNLGPAREDERLVMDGLPWRIDSLNFQSVLVNPALEGGELRLPVKSLIGMYSRPCVENERWFPCEVGDWVRLENGDGCGKVICQTMEMVCLEPLGKAPVTYQTAEFLKLNPQNLSHGFRISTTFGIDYRHQEDSTTTIPNRMRQALTEGLTAYIEPEHLRNVEVDLLEAAASSINYDIDVDVSGEAAPHYETLERALTKLLIEACNANGWSIPFTQITLHQAVPASQESLP